jgi:sugar (pentulose or hexulose) kinase
VLDALGVPEQILPAVVRSGMQLGTVCAEAAEMTGIPAGTPIIAGMTDGCAAQIGAGALEVGSWNSVLGTTLVLKGVTRELIRDPAGVVYSHRSPDGNWLPGGASSTGAAVLAEQFPGSNLDALSAQAAEREPASIVAYPLVSRGERFPFLAPDAEGFLLGDPSDEIDLYAALLQGVAFIERLCFDYFDMLGAPIDGQLSLTGGAARSRYWCQLRADILNRPVRLLENAEPALGMAVLAASVGRRVSDVAKEMVRVRAVIEPRPYRFPRFHESYLRLVEELARRGWLQSAVVEHAQGRPALEG